MYLKIYDAFSKQERTKRVHYVRKEEVDYTVELENVGSVWRVVIYVVTPTQKIAGKVLEFNEDDPNFVYLNIDRLVNEFLYEVEVVSFQPLTIIED